MSGLKLAACPFFFFLARRHFLWKSPRKHSPRQEMLKRQHFERCDHRAVKQNWGVEGQKRWCSALPLLDVASPWPAETQWAWRTDFSRIYVRRKRAAEQSTEAQGEGGCICPVCPHFLIPVVILRKSISRGTAGQGGSTDPETEEEAVRGTGENAQGLCTGRSTLALLWSTRASNGVSPPASIGIKLPTSEQHRESKRVPEKHLFLLYWLCQSLWLCGSQ